MSAVGIIPARWASSRFPGKALAPIAGLALIERTWRGASTAKTLRKILVATDDDRIANACTAFGAQVVRTRTDHATGTDRLGEVAAALPDEILVNIQGDEPLIEGFVIDAAVEALRADPGASLATLVHAIGEEELLDPNRVKAVVDTHGRAIAFARATPRASDRGDRGDRVYQHVGLYAYRRDVLLELVELEPTAGELELGLEQLRALEHGHAIAAAIVEGWHSIPVDVPADIANVEAALAARDTGESA
jgi:3-deoxy-manno-octulosonate cytidylyltransferase (CMP-KDO synthetase)